jgi:alkanesulfonate monooxygenase SsuD/methylene tetrahydromethanopterin reductase-like flavin-dependent oxidoreductase (luciferase family)
LVGGHGERLLTATLPYVDAWNTWFERFGNRADGLAPRLRRVDEICEQVGRDPSIVARSVCVLVEVEGGAGERAAKPGVPPLRPDELPAELRALQEAGVDEVILVLDPINERSIRALDVPRRAGPT